MKIVIAAIIANVRLNTNAIRTAIVLKALPAMPHAIANLNAIAVKSKVQPIIAPAVEAKTSESLAYGRN